MSEIELICILLCKRVAIELTWTVLLYSYMFYMNVDKWARYGQFLLINGSREFILLY